MADGSGASGALLAYEYDSSDSGDEEIGPQLSHKAKNQIRTTSDCSGIISTEANGRSDVEGTEGSNRWKKKITDISVTSDGPLLSYSTPIGPQIQSNKHRNEMPSTRTTVFHESSFPSQHAQQREMGPFLPPHYGSSSYSSGYNELHKASIGPIRPEVTKTNNTTSKIRPYVSKREREKLQQTSKTARSEAVVTGKVNNFVGEITEVKGQADSVAVVNRPPKRVITQFQGHSKCVNHVRWNPAKHNLLASASMDHTVAIWDTNRNALCLSRLTFHEAAVKDVKWRPCGTQVLSCGYDKCAKLTDIDTGKMMQNFPHKYFVTCVQFHPTDSNLFLTGTSRNGIYCWDIRQEKIVSTYQSPFGQVQDMAFLPGCEQFISAAEVLRRNSTDKGIMVWDLRTTAVMSNQIYQEAFTCTCLKVHPSGAFFAAQSNANYIALFSTKRPYKLNKFKRYEGHQVSAYVIGFDFSPDGSLTVSGSSDGKMYIYNSQTSRNISSLPVHSSVCMDTNYHPSLPSTVATCSFDGHIAILV